MRPGVTPLGLEGAFLLSGRRHSDPRGDFTNVLDLELLESVTGGIAPAYIASAHNLRRGTVRGLHYQTPPHEEAKTVWCTTGAIFDVLVDLRVDQPTFGQWISIELSATDADALHIPRGVAHGYQSTEENTLVHYLISGQYQPSSARTVKWDDPTLGINWPLPVSVISARDAAGQPWEPQ